MGGPSYQAIAKEWGRLAHLGIDIELRAVLGIQNWILLVSGYKAAEHIWRIVVLREDAGVQGQESRCS